jgi:hypothetical protein
MIDIWARVTQNVRMGVKDLRSTTVTHVFRIVSGMPSARVSAIATGLERTVPSRQCPMTLQTAIPNALPAAGRATLTVSSEFLQPRRISTASVSVKKVGWMRTVPYTHAGVALGIPAQTAIQSAMAVQDRLSTTVSSVHPMRRRTAWGPVSEKVAGQATLVISSQPLVLILSADMADLKALVGTTPTQWAVLAMAIRTADSLPTQCLDLGITQEEVARGQEAMVG